jgi:hypothetical protein
MERKNWWAHQTEIVCVLERVFNKRYIAISLLPVSCSRLIQPKDSKDAGKYTYVHVPSGDRTPTFSVFNT